MPKDPTIVLSYMPGKVTLYVRDNDLWRRAREASGPGGLSDLVHRLLRQWLERPDVSASPPRCSSGPAACNMTQPHWCGRSKRRRHARGHAHTGSGVQRARSRLVGPTGDIRDRTVDIMPFHVNG